MNLLCCRHNNSIDCVDVCSVCGSRIHYVTLLIIGLLSLTLLPCVDYACAVRMRDSLLSLSLNSCSPTTHLTSWSLQSTIQSWVLSASVGSLLPCSSWGRGYVSYFPCCEFDLFQFWNTYTFLVSILSVFLVLISFLLLIPYS